MHYPENKLHCVDGNDDEAEEQVAGDHKLICVYLFRLYCMGQAHQHLLSLCDDICCHYEIFLQHHHAHKYRLVRQGVMDAKLTS